MCGGIVYNIMKIPKSELLKFYADDEIAKFEEKGQFESFFWSRQPVLPIEENGNIKLKKWGNRDKNLHLPQTGWAKTESINRGKWTHLRPKMVKIPVDKGYEKGVWFDVKSKGFQGIIINKDKLERVYMITKQADKEYEKLTKHNRQPIEI